jgi:desulfoferrodoxin (superoxide reductase-like protein)
MKNIILSIIASIAIIAVTGTGCSDDNKSKIKYRSVPLAEYTREAPDQWEGLEGSHTPVVTIRQDSDPDIIITVKLRNPEANHYIETIGIMDENRQVLLSKKFTRNDKFFDAFFSSKDLIKKGKLKAFARCSMHDLWTEPLEIK